MAEAPKVARTSGEAGSTAATVSGASFGAVENFCGARGGGVTVAPGEAAAGVKAEGAGTRWFKRELGVAACVASAGRWSLKF